MYVVWTIRAAKTVIIIYTYIIITFITFIRLYYGKIKTKFEC